MAIKKTQAIILLEREKLTYYSVNQSAAFVFPFTPEFVRDLDVVNKLQFDTALKLFIQTQKISPADIIIMFADELLFETDIITPISKTPMLVNDKQRGAPVTPRLPESSLPEISQGEKIKAFVDTVPFENIMVKTYTIQKGIKVVAGNRDMYEGIKGAFSSIGSTIEAVVPVFLVKNPGSPTSIGPNELRKALSQIDFLKQQSFPLHVEELRSEEEKTGTFKLTLNKGGNKKRLAALICVFALLVGVMGIMFMLTNTSSQTITSHASNHQARPSVPVVFLSPTVLPSIIFASPSPIASLSGLINSTVKFHIETSVINSQIKQLQNALESAGLKNIVVTLQSGITSSQSLLLFSESVSADNKEKITQIVAGVFPNVVVQMATGLQSDVVLQAQL